MKRIALTALFALTTACASAPVTPPTSDTATGVDSTGVSIARQTTTPLRQQALDLFAAASEAERGVSFSLDLDALRARGILSNDPKIAGGYTLVQALAPLVGELTIFKSEWTRPLSELLVHASVVDRAVPFPKVKRLGLYVPRVAPLSASTRVADVARQSALLVGVEADAAAVRAILSSYAAIVRASRPSVSSAIGERGPVPEVALVDGSLCVLEGDDRAPLACLFGGDGVYVLGTPQVLDALKSRGAASDSTRGGGTNTPDATGNTPIQFFSLAYADDKVGRVFARAFGDDDLTLTIALDSPTEAISQQFAQVAHLFLARRQQAQREFSVATAMALQNVQAAIGQDAQAPEDLRAAVSQLTVDAIFDPYGTGLMNPDNVALTQDGKVLTLTARLPAAHVDHHIVTWRNMSAFEFSLYSGLPRALLALFKPRDTAPDTAPASPDAAGPIADAAE